MDETDVFLIQYFRPGSDDAKSFEEVWEILDDETQELIDFDPPAAYLSITQDGRRLKLFSFGDGLIWNSVSKSMYVLLRNSQLRFIREDGSMELDFWIETPTGEIKSIITNGTVTAVRVG